MVTCELAADCCTGNRDFLRTRLERKALWSPAFASAIVAGYRDAFEAQAAREELRRVVGFSAADEIAKLEQLKKAGSISNDEFTRLRAKLTQ